MYCPACRTTLDKLVINNIELDICQNGCGGIWFDQFEFKKFDEPHEFAGAALLDIETGQKITTIDHKAERQCPRCQDTKMVQHFYSPKQQIEIDECYTCGGIWLDYGELIRIRNIFGSEQARRDYARHHLHKEFGAELDKFCKESAEKTERATRFANMFRYLYPSWYLPGKQDWGTF